MEAAHGRLGLIALLRLIPIWAYALAAAVTWGGFQRYRANEVGAQLARHITETAQLREQAMHSALIETTRRLSAQQEVADHAQASTRRAQADATAAAGAAGRLRAYAASLAIGAGACNPAPASIGPAASAPGVVLADLLGRLEAGGRSLAEEADRRGIAGAECVGRYEALTR